jgi:hypothetical protein
MAKRKRKTLIITSEQWLDVYMAATRGISGSVVLENVAAEEDVEEVANGIDDIATAVADLAADALQERFGPPGEEDDEEEDDE